MADAQVDGALVTQEDADAEFDQGAIVYSNSLGSFDGQTFYLRSFAVWYRWLPTQYQQRYQKFNQYTQESGSDKEVYYEQSMGKIVLWYELRGENLKLTEDEISVDMSSWALQVTVGKGGKPGKREGRKLDGLCGEFFLDIRRRHSWWQIVEDGDSEFPGRWLTFVLSKQEHRSWKKVWYDAPFNLHRKEIYYLGWTAISRELRKHLKSEEETLAAVEAGEPQEPEKALFTAVLPERLCTGVDDDQDETAEHISVLVHLDQDTLDLASGTTPLEELFCADVQAGRLDVYLRFDGFAICSGELLGRCRPELTTWEVAQVRRRLPPDSKIKDPAYLNPAIRITLTKADGHQNFWGHAFSDFQMPQCQPPRERDSFTDRMQRAMVLSPVAPTNATAKSERAQKLCTSMEIETDDDQVVIRMHIDETIGELFWKYKVDPATFFGLKVGEKSVEVNVLADMEFRICHGRLGGSCVPDQTSWEVLLEENSPGSEAQHAVLRIGLVKAPSSTWTEDVFTRIEPWQVTEELQQSLLDNPPLDALAA